MVKIALLGAESTGKTQLANALAAHLRRDGRAVAMVAEVLREWCTREGRVPHPGEQMSIARDQESRVDAAARHNAIVVADTTALMVTIHAGMLFPDGELLRFALARQRSYDFTLVMGLDLPWVADGLQREGPHVRAPVDALLRGTLADAGVPFRVVYGNGADRLQSALAAIGEIATGSRDATCGTGAVRWRWRCDKCSDPQCEHQLFTGQLPRS